MARRRKVKLGSGWGMTASAGHRHFWNHVTDGAGQIHSVCRCGDQREGKWWGEVRKDTPARKW